MVHNVYANGRTFADLLQAYRRDFLPHKSPKTQYQEGLLYDWFGQIFGTMLMEQLTPLVLRTWRDSLVLVYKPSTIRRYMTALSAVFTAAVDQYEWLPKHPMRHRVMKPASPPDRERWLTVDELASLLACCASSTNPHLLVAVKVALSTAARKNEVLQRTWGTGEVDLDRRLLSIPQTKNGERRAVPLLMPLIDLLQQHRDRFRSRWVFPRADGRKPVLIDYAWRSARDRAGIIDFHFHDLRHTTATYLAMTGATIEEIRLVLGHKTLAQTRKYIHLVEPPTRSALTTMADRFLALLLFACTLAMLESVWLTLP